MNALVVGGLLALGAAWFWKTWTTPPRAFISFAVEDARARDLFVGQGRHRKTPWNLEDASLHEPFSDRWKTRAREHIRRCDVVIQLIGEGTHRAEGAIWEVNCARAENIPVFGVWISKGGPHRRPSCFERDDVIPWTWDGVQARLERALQDSRAAR